MEVQMRPTFSCPQASLEPPEVVKGVPVHGRTLKSLLSRALLGFHETFGNFQTPGVSLGRAELSPRLLELFWALWAGSGWVLGQGSSHTGPQGTGTAPGAAQAGILGGGSGIPRVLPNLSRFGVLRDPNHQTPSRRAGGDTWGRTRNVGVAPGRGWQQPQVTPVPHSVPGDRHVRLQRAERRRAGLQQGAAHHRAQQGRPRLVERGGQRPRGAFPIQLREADHGHGPQPAV